MNKEGINIDTYNVPYAQPFASGLNEEETENGFTRGNIMIISIQRMYSVLRHHRTISEDNPVRVMMILTITRVVWQQVIIN